MLLGIDASRAVAAAPTGTENYSRQLIGALLTARSALRFRLYTRAAPPPGLFPNSPNCEIRSIPFPRLWTHLRLSAELAAHPPDALFVPAHVLPPVHPRRSLVTVHDLGYLYFRRAHRALDRFYLDLSTRWKVRAAAAVIADSEATRADLVRFYGAPQQKIRVIYPALDPNWLDRAIGSADIARVRQRYRLAPEYLIAVGTLQPRKNYGRLLQAFERLPAELQLVIVGKKGWLYQGLMEQIRLRGLAGRVNLLDYAPAADLPALYAGAQLAVLPSLYEGFGLPVLEAQACGTPVACSSTSSLPEAAGNAAEFFDPRDPAAIAAAIARVLNDPARRDELITLGRANVARFSWESAAAHVIELAQEL